MNYFARCVGQELIKRQLPTKSSFCYFSRLLTQNAEYKSVYALENLYPKKNVKLFTPTFVSKLDL